MYHKIALGVDIGGSHITAALVDLESKTVIPASQARAHVNAQDTAQEVLATWGAVMSKALGVHDPAELRIGIAIPGPFDYKQGICLFQNQHKYDCLYGLNVKELLARQLSSRIENIKLINDASCFLMGEAFGGAARNTTSAIGLTLGTGLGSAVLQDGIAQDADLWCTPFKDSIAEEYLSTRALVRAYARLSDKTVANVKELATLYPDDVDAQKIFDAFAENLALFLVPHLEARQPEMVVIGGNIAKAWDLFIPTTATTLAFMGLHVPLQRAELDEGAALVGAASYWHAAAKRKRRREN